MVKRHSRVPGTVLDGVDWSRFSVVLLKPDCLRRGLAEEILAVLASQVEIVTTDRVVVADWQIFVHYWDLLVDRDWFSVDVVDYLRRTYVGQEVVVALARSGSQDTPARVRGLIGHYDPSQAGQQTIRGRFGADSLEVSRREGRLIENLIHGSDDAATVCRDFGTWFGANRHELLDEHPAATAGVSRP
jgi:nucleoside-diphosphate kinase